MVKSESDLSSRLGSVLLWGAFSGVGLWFLSVFSIVASGEKLSSMPFSLTWIFNAESIFELGAGIGMLVLAATPVSMLAVFVVFSIAQRKTRPIAVGLSVMAVVISAQFIAMMS